MRFWDSSAIVPLLLEQTGSEEAEGWLSEDKHPAIWTLTPTEVISALRRLVREGALDENAADLVEARLCEFYRACHVVIDVERVKALAARLLRLHSLRAADALQLGAALKWCEGRTEGKVLHTLDDRLALAAHREGFRVIPWP